MVTPANFNRESGGERERGRKCFRAKETSETYQLISVFGPYFDSDLHTYTCIPTLLICIHTVGRMVNTDCKSNDIKKLMLTF